MVLASHRDPKVRLDPEPLRALARDLRRQQPELAREFSKAMRRSVQPVVDAEKDAARKVKVKRGAMPSKRRLSRKDARGWRPMQNPRGSLRHALVASIRQDTAISGGRMTRVGVKMSGSLFARSLRSQRGRARSAEKLPRYIEGEAPRWRHPFMGKRTVWYGASSSPFFMDTAKRMRPRVDAEIQRTMNEFARRATRKDYT